MAASMAGITGVAGLGAVGQVGSRAINEISEVLEILNKPSYTVTTTTLKGKKKTIVETISISKLDIIMAITAIVTAILYAQGWRPGDYLNEFGEWVSGSVPGADIGGGEGAWWSGIGLASGAKAPWWTLPGLVQFIGDEAAKLKIDWNPFD